jgi:hypothetical protein
MEVADAQMNQVLSCKGPLRRTNSPTSDGEVATRIAADRGQDICALHQLSRREK